MQPLSFAARFFFAWAAFFRVLFDGTYAAQAKQLTAAAPPAPTPEPVQVRDADAALELLALLQEQGRFVDFVQEDITAASDADVGVAARVVHAGCRKVLAERAHIVPLRSEEEGTEVVVSAGFSPAEIKLTGALRGAAPFRGILRHRGWLAEKLTLPAPTGTHRADILAAAEVEL